MRISFFVRCFMKKFLIALLTVLCLFCIVACNSQSLSDKTTADIHSYADEAKQVLLDYDKSSYASTIDRATEDSLAYIPYCADDKDFQTVKDLHTCIVSFILANQIYDASSAEYTMVQSDYNYYISQTNYIRNQISQIEKSYSRKINSAAEYIEITVGRPDQYLINNYISKLKAECESETYPYRLQLQQLESQYAGIQQYMQSLETQLNTASEAMDLCGIKYDQLFDTLEALKS